LEAFLVPFRQTFEAVEDHPFHPFPVAFLLAKFHLEDQHHHPLMQEFGVELLVVAFLAHPFHHPFLEVAFPEAFLVVPFLVDLVVHHHLVGPLMPLAIVEEYFHPHHPHEAEVY
jgi:hypothetical protein